MKGPGRQNARRYNRRRIAESLENVSEYVGSFTFALTDHDAPHQEHFRRQAQAWCLELRRALQPKTAVKARSRR